MSEADRIAAISARANVLFTRISKAVGPKRPRVPGDGDGDGIPNESRRKKPAALGANDKFAEQHVTSGQSVSVLRLSNVNMSEGTAQFKGEGRVWEARRVHVKGTPKPQWKLTGEYSEVHKAGPKRPRIPGDGDGDGIAYEGRNKPGAAGAPKKAPSLIDVLNHPEGRRLVEAIEDTMSSLEGKKNDKILGNVLRAQAQELKDRFGFDHYGAKELVQQHLGSPSPAPVAPAPGTKWSSHAVMVHPQTGQRTVVPRSSAKNFPESEGWKEVGPGVKTPKPTKR